MKLILCILLLSSSILSQQKNEFGPIFNTILIRTEHMYIKDAELYKPDGKYHNDDEINFHRHYNHVYFGKTMRGGAYSLGFIHQLTYKSDDSNFKNDKFFDTYGALQQGLMIDLHGSYNLNDFMRLTGGYKFGVLQDEDDGNIGPPNPLYSEDTEFSIGTTFFSGEGWEVDPDSFDHLYPSIYINYVQNRYDRGQLIIGGGAWYKNFTLYLTRVESLNGEKGAPNFASFKNKSTTLSLSYEYQSWLARVHQTFPSLNSGNDFTFSLEYLIPLTK